MNTTPELFLPDDPVEVAERIAELKKQKAARLSDYMTASEEEQRELFDLIIDINLQLQDLERIAKG